MRFPSAAPSVPALLATVLTTAALLGGCSGNGGKPVATPSSPPAQAATAAPPVVGPVFVYSFETPMAQRQGSVDLTVVAFDERTWRELHRTVLPSARVMSLQLGSQDLLFYIFSAGRAAEPDELRSLDPVTGDTRTLYTTTTGFGPSIALSPDGSTLAFSEADKWNYPTPTDVRVLDVSSAAVRTVATFTPQSPAGFFGTPVPVVWRDDGRGFVVLGASGTDAGGYATVMLDGTVVVHRERDAMYVAPSGRAAATGGYGDSACALAAVGRTQPLALWDLDANRITNGIEDPALGIRQVTWSPAGDALLYRQLSPEESQASCARTGPEPLGKTFLLSVHGGQPVPVDDVATLRRQWSGDRIIDFECGAETVFNPYGYCVFDAATGRMFLNGREVASGEVMRAIGFIDPRR